MKNIISILLLCLSISIFSQKDNKSILFEDERDAKDFKEFSENELNTELKYDSLAIKEELLQNGEGEYQLDQVVVYSMPVFRNKLERSYYNWLIKKVYKAYPLYLKANENYTNIQDSIIKYDGNKKIKKALKARQKELANEYENQLRKLTRTEGQILCKLLYRKTDKTTFEIIKELRGGWNAFWWNTKAGLFDIDLKKTYDIENVREDYFIETIIQNGTRKGMLRSD